MESPPIKVFWYAPQPIFVARVNMPGTISYPIQEVTFDNITVGAYSDVTVDMLVTFGSAEGLDDYGRTRARGTPTSTTLKIGRSSQGFEDGQVNIVDNAWIHVYEDYRVFTKIPRIGPAPDYTEFKDADIEVDNYTQFPPPVANTGPAYARSIDADTGAITVVLNGAGSFAVADDATITSYAWDVKDGTIVFGGAPTDVAIFVEFPAGFRWATLTVTDSNGKTHTSRVPILADDPDNSLCVPGMQVTNITRNQQGSTARLRVLDDLPRADYPDGALVMIWEDRDPQIYGTPDPTFRQNLLFLGWHQTDRAGSRALETHLARETELTCVDVAGRLDSLPGFPQRLELPDEEEGLTWGEMPAPNMDKFLHYLIHWHSTAASLTDFYTSGTGADYAFVIFDAVGDTLYNQLSRQAQRMVPDYAFTCDRYGALRVVPNPQYQNPADRTATIQNSATEQNWSEIDFSYQRSPRVHTLRASALLVQSEWILDDEGNKTLQTAFAVAPGTSPGQGAREQTLGERLAPSQQALNDVAGHHLARQNARYGEVTVTLNSNSNPWSFDPSAYTWVQLMTTAATAPYRGLDFTTVRALCREVSVDYVYREEATLARGRVVLELETSGLPAVTEEHEEALPPGEQPEPPPGPVVYVPDYGLRAGVNNVAMVSDDGYIYRTSNFQDVSPTWTRVQDSAEQLQYDSISFVVDPFSPLYRGTGSTVNCFVADHYGVHRYEDIFGVAPAWVELGWFDAFSNNYDVDQWRTLDASFGRYQETESNNPWLLAVSYVADGSPSGVHAVYSMDAGQNWNGNLPAPVSAFTELTVASGYDTNAATHGLQPLALYLSPKTPGLAYTFAYPANGTPAESKLYKTEDWGATWTQISSVSAGHSLGFALHFPWPDNSDEALFYHGWANRSGTLQYQLRRVQGGVSADISPTDGGVKYGVAGAIYPGTATFVGEYRAYGVKFGVRTYDSDRRYMVLAGMGNDASANINDNKFAVFVSDDYGATWTRITPVVTGTNPHAQEAAFSGTDPNVIFMWGRSGYIAYTNDFGDTVQDKTGNLGSFTNPTVGNIIGIMGGDGPP